MSTPLTASARIHIPYIAQGRAHSLRHYVRIVTDGAHPLIGVIGSDVGLLWSDAAVRAAFLMHLELPAGSSVGTLVLEKKSGIVWNPVDAIAPGTLTFSGTAFPATQITAVMRDTTFKQIRVEVLDTAVAAPQHYGGIPSTGLMDSWLEHFTLAGQDDPTDPYWWVVSRGNNHLQDAPIAGITVDLNDRIRRDAGLV